MLQSAFFKRSIRRCKEFALQDLRPLSRGCMRESTSHRPYESTRPFGRPPRRLMQAAHFLNCSIRFIEDTHQGAQVEEAPS